VKLSIATLKENNAFSAKPVEVQFEWKGETITTYVRHLSYQTAVGDIKAVNGGDIYANRIAASICDEDGKPVFTVADVTGEPVYGRDAEGKTVLVSDPERGGLDPELTNLLLIEIGKVQNLGKTKS
jgi:hypothetical protein